MTAPDARPRPGRAVARSQQPGRVEAGCASAATGRADVAWADARRLAYRIVTAPPAARVPSAQAAGAVLAAPLCAREAMPAFDTAAMDGYAVGSAGRCRIVGTVLAGDPPGRLRLAPGEAARIATGAPAPHGTRHVLRQEDAVLAGGYVDGPDAPRGTHVRCRGEDAQPGEALAAAGATIGAALLGLAAACGHSMLPIIPVPVVAGIISGDEIAAPGGVETGGVETGGVVPVAPGQLRDAIGPMLPPLVAGFGGRLGGVVHVPDHPPERLAAAIEAACADGAAVVIVSGATSVGPADGLRGALRGLGAELIIESVACRPGHPQLLARLPRPDSERWLIGLPGNPFAALVALHTLAAPVLAKLGGRPEPVLPMIVPTGIAAGEGKSGTRLLPVTWAGVPVGGAAARRPASLRAAAGADALAAIPADWEPGQPVPAVPLGADLRACAATR